MNCSKQRALMNLINVLFEGLQNELKHWNKLLIQKFTELSSHSVLMIKNSDVTLQGNFHQELNIISTLEHLARTSKLIAQNNVLISFPSWLAYVYCAYAELNNWFTFQFSYWCWILQAKGENTSKRTKSHIHVATCANNTVDWVFV